MMSTFQLVEQQKVKSLADQPESRLNVKLVRHPVEESAYALEIKIGQDSFLLKRQKVKRARSFKSLDAAWALATKLGISKMTIAGFDESVVTH